MPVQELWINDKGDSIAVCLNLRCNENPFHCPCGYAEGLCKPRYPMPVVARRNNDDKDTGV